MQNVHVYAHNELNEESKEAMSNARALKWNSNVSKMNISFYVE
jgi:hypothetical protein